VPAYFEPFRIKAVEPLPLSTRAERAEALVRAGYNVFRLRAAEVTIDLLTDSGTGAMSAAQWAALMVGDESYAQATSFERFERVARELTGCPFIIPAHQGRAAERILFSCLLAPGRISVSNTHFDTTRANVELLGATALDLPCRESEDLSSEAPFKGNLDLDRLDALLASGDGARVACVVMTLTNNLGGGQPVSLAHLRDVRGRCERYGLPLLLDAARFAENAYLVSVREPDRRGHTPRAIAEEAFGLCDGAWASLKKDGLGNIGGLIALRDPELARRCQELLIATEGFSTYGGLAGRDLEALAQGLEEVVDPAYLAYRAESTAWLADTLRAGGVPVVRPPGCHAVYVDAGALLQAGVRAAEMGSFGFAGTSPDGSFAPAAHELMRLALPRRVYTRNHLEYVAEALIGIAADPKALRGYRIVEQPAVLRHFTASLEPI
jgi:tryptophanase